MSCNNIFFVTFHFNNENVKKIWECMNDICTCVFVCYLDKENIWSYYLNS